MFEKHFKLVENPFSLTPDPRFIYPGKSHEEALATLRYWVEHREGFVMVTGEVGTGKTTSLFRLIDSLEQRFEIAFITNSTLNTVELLEEVCRRFKIEGITPGLTKSALLQRLEAYLLKLRELRHAAILIIDEAQNFDAELLEEVRLLSNTVVPIGPPLLQIALVGQPELDRKLNLEELRQLRQRIGVHYRIEPLSEEETIRYVRHRIGVAGGNPDLVFGADAARQLYRYTRGLPREINQVASQAMLHAFVDGAPGVTAEHVRSAAWEMKFRSVLDRGDAEMAAAPEVPVSPPPQPTVPPVPAPEAPVAPAPVVAPPVAPVAVEPAVAPPVVQEPPRPAEAMPGLTVLAPATSGPLLKPVPPLKTVPPLELPASRGHGSAEPAPVLTRVSRFGPLPETGAVEAGAQSPSLWLRLGLAALALALLAVAGWFLFLPKTKTPEETPSGGPLSGLAADSLAGVLRAAAVPETASAAVDSVRHRLNAMHGPPDSGLASKTPAVAAPTATGPNAARDTVKTPPSLSPATPAPAVAPPPVTASPGLPFDAWRLQVASFRDSALAYREARRLSQRMNWSYEVVRGRLRDQGFIYAILVGPFASKADADSAKQQILALKLGFKEAIAKPPRGRR